MRNSGRESLLPGDAMENQKNQPTGKCDQATRNGNEHEPSHHAELIKKLAVVVSIDDARMHRAFIHLAAVSIRNAAHSITDPIGANANKTMRMRAIK